MKTFLKYLPAATVAAAIAPMARAIPELLITDGTNSVLTSDNHLIATVGVDSNAALGKVNWAGTIGTWAVDVGFGITYPSIGSLPYPSMDSTFNVTSIGSGTLWFYFSNDGFGPTVGARALASVGGTAGNSVAYNLYGGNSNILFDTSSLLASVGTLGPGAFSGAMGSGLINNPGPYALTQELVITHVGVKNSSGDSLAAVSVPDNGAMLILLGTGLTALALIRRRRTS